MPDLAAPFARACLALDLMRIDPSLGGLRIVARAGPVRDRLAQRLVSADQRPIRLHPSMDDEALFGGLDVAATLAAGAPVMRAGRLAAQGLFLLPMAERIPPALAARLGAALEGGPERMIVAFDESAEDEDGPPAALSDRLGFCVDLSDVGLADAVAPPPGDLAAARLRLRHILTPPDLPQSLAELCAAFGVAGARAPLFALRAARASAAMNDRQITDADIETAAALTLAHRATRSPEPSAPEEEAPEEPRPELESEPRTESDTEPAKADMPQEILVAAVTACLPPDLLRPPGGAVRGPAGHGAGALSKGNRRGRPLPPRPIRPASDARIDVYATLRAAVPWQMLRAKGTPAQGRISIRKSDLRFRRHLDRSDRLLIFTVDASGSAALARLAESKGAIEILLAEAYSRRDHVSLIAFRGAGAEILLPPTRSLVQTRRRLADLPGGGATPLAAGLEAAGELAEQARRRGMTPVICLLTDGRANISLDGTADRARAAEDAQTIGRKLRFRGIDGLVIDCGRRPEPSLSLLSETLNCPYLPLPRADAARLSRAVSSALA